MTLYRTLLHNPVVRNSASVVAIAAGGYMLLTLTFLLDALFHSAVVAIVRAMSTRDPLVVFPWFPPAMHITFAVLIGLITWAIVKTSLRPLYKAILMTVPLAVFHVTIGMFLYQWGPVPYIISGVCTMGLLYYLYQSKKSWLYAFTVILVSLTLMLFTLLGGEI